MDDLRGERRETTEGGRTIIREPDRTIIREGDHTIIRHNEVERFRYGARDVQIERRGNDNVTIVVRPDGDRVVTVVDAERLSAPPLPHPAGRARDHHHRQPAARSGLRPGPGAFFVDVPPPVIRIPRERYIVDMRGASPALLYDTLMAPPVEAIERPYSLDEIRYSAPLRDRMPRIDLDTVTFETGVVGADAPTRSSCWRRSRTASTGRSSAIRARCS